MIISNSLTHLYTEVVCGGNHNGGIHHFFSSTEVEVFSNRVVNILVQ